MSKKTSIRSFLLMAAGTLALGACTGSNDVSYNTNKTIAPIPPSDGQNLSASTPAITPEQRISELEATVENLRADYEKIMPAFASLNTTNDRIQTLLNELEGRGGVAKTDVTKANTAQPQPSVIPLSPPKKMEMTEFKGDEILVMDDKPTKDVAKLAPVSANIPVVSSVSSPPTSAKAMSSSVTAMRIGEHGEKTRLVFDLSSKTKPDFSYDLDNEEKLLMVDMPSSSWVGQNTGKPKNSLMVSAWNVQPLASGGSVVAIQLKKDARVLSTEFLKSEGNDPAKMVMDIGAGE